MSYLLFCIIALCNVKLSMLINDYAIRHVPFKKVKVLRTSVLELSMIKDRPTQRELPGTQRAAEQETLASVPVNITLVVREMRANWSKD